MFVLYYNYEKLVKNTIPAVRIAVSITLKEKYNMSETQIAKRLGIAQAAVSKYLSGNYSPRIGKLVKFVQLGRLQDQIVKAIMAGEEEEEILNRIDKTASNKRLIEKAAK